MKTNIAVGVLLLGGISITAIGLIGSYGWFGVQLCGVLLVFLSWAIAYYSQNEPQ